MYRLADPYPALRQYGYFPGMTRSIDLVAARSLGSNIIFKKRFSGDFFEVTYDMV